MSRVVLGGEWGQPGQQGHERCWRPMRAGSPGCAKERALTLEKEEVGWCHGLGWA